MTTDYKQPTNTPPLPATPPKGSKKPLAARSVLTLLTSRAGAVLTGVALVVGLLAGGVGVAAIQPEVEATPVYQAAMDTVAERDASIDTLEADMAEAEKSIELRESGLEADAEVLDARASQLDDRESEIGAREEAADKADEKAAKKEAANSFAGSGVHLVGTDIKPGTYRSKDNSSCYWARLSGVSGSFDEILANDNVTGDTVVEILPSDYAFEANRCSSFERVG